MCVMIRRGPHTDTAPTKTMGFWIVFPLVSITGVSEQKRNKFLDLPFVFLYVGTFLSQAVAPVYLKQLETMSYEE